jgi:uncharacterized protein YutE (UPF0331/DUF86 family)
VQLGAVARYEAYHRMVQFRNFIVHRYEHIDTTILADIVNQRLGDIERFRVVMIAALRKVEERGSALVTWFDQSTRLLYGS